MSLPENWQKRLAKISLVPVLLGDIARVCQLCINFDIQTKVSLIFIDENGQVNDEEE